MKTKFFMFLPVILLGLSFAGWGVMISAATADPSFSVEPGYYRKAANFEQELAARAKTRELGLHAAVVQFRRMPSGELLLELAFTGRTGAPLADVGLDLEALANLRAAETRTGTSVTDQRGHAVWRLASGAPGLWELRLRGRLGPDVFTDVVRAELAEGKDRT
jgi:hypothetical protein